MLCGVQLAVLMLVVEQSSVVVKVCVDTVIVVSPVAKAAAMMLANGRRIQEICMVVDV